MASKKLVGVKKDFRSEYEALQRDMRGVDVDLKHVYYKEFFRSIAKAADQRLVNLERLSNKKGYTEVTEWSYANAMRDIRAMYGDGAKRFNRVQPENLNSIYKNINRVLNFLEAPTSSKQGIDEIYMKRADTIKSKYGINMSWSKTATVFDTMLWKKVSTKPGSATYLKSMGIIRANKKEILRQLEENKPVSVIVTAETDPKKLKELQKKNPKKIITSAESKDINVERTINKLLRYYKKDVKSLLKEKNE